MDTRISPHGDQWAVATMYTYTAKQLLRIHTELLKGTPIEWKSGTVRVATGNFHRRRLLHGQRVVQLRHPDAGALHLLRRLRDDVPADLHQLQVEVSGTHALASAHL